MTKAAVTLFALFFAAVPVAVKAADPAPQTATAKKKTATVGTRGTAQMKGGDGVFGQTYTLKNGANFTLVSAEYTVERFSYEPTSVIIPKADEKLLLLHLRLQNPRKEDLYIKGNALTFATVAMDDKTRDGTSDMRLTSAKEDLANTLKPGQKFTEDVLTVCVVPAVGPVPKLILNTGREGTSEEVTRYFLGAGKNIVTKLPAPYADTKDPSGSTALTEVPAKIGVAYKAGFYDITLNSITFAPGPFGETAAGAGKRFIVANVTVTNKTWDGNYLKDFILASLTTSDDEKSDQFIRLKGKRDEEWEGRKVEPGESVTMRLLFEQPLDVTGKTLKLLEAVDNSGGLSRAFVFDISAAR